MTGGGMIIINQLNDMDQNNLLNLVKISISSNTLYLMKLI